MNVLTIDIFYHGIGTQGQLGLLAAALGRAGREDRMGDVRRLDAGGVTVLVRLEAAAPPEVLYWGASLP